jgi:hypothetical protein
MLESTRSLSIDHRRDVFSSNGISYDRVLKYYSNVVFMERMMDKADQDYWQKIRHVFGIRSD